MRFGVSPSTESDVMDSNHVNATNSLHYSQGKLWAGKLCDQLAISPQNYRQFLDKRNKHDVN